MVCYCHLGDHPSTENDGSYVALRTRRVYTGDGWMGMGGWCETATWMTSRDAAKSAVVRPHQVLGILLVDTCRHVYMICTLGVGITRFPSCFYKQIDDRQCDYKNQGMYQLPGYLRTFSGVVSRMWNFLTWSFLGYVINTNGE
jgi:hypothetical protein